MRIRADHHVLGPACKNGAMTVFVIAIALAGAALASAEFNFLSIGDWGAAAISDEFGANQHMVIENRQIRPSRAL